MKKTINNKTIHWLSVKWIKVSEDSPDTMFFKYDFSGDSFLEVMVQQSSLRGRKPLIQNVGLSAAYVSKLPISN